MALSITPNFALNIVCYDVPFPADYGGAMEEFYKIKSLHQLGAKIYLHCFVYGNRQASQTLEKYCVKVYYYQRQRKLKDAFKKTPFIVKTRMDNELLRNLQSNNFPILFDATHTTGFINEPSLKSRVKVVRLHNIEWIYYHILFHSAFSLYEKIFYFLEYKKLKKHDKYLAFADGLSCLSDTDYAYYSDKFPKKNIQYIPVFHENSEVTCKEGKGKYLLYHGNLSLIDNCEVIINVLSNELKNCHYPIIIAGKNPSPTLIDFVKNKSNIQLQPNPSQAQLDNLIEDAHICLAIAKNPSGVKLKLINSLFKSRFVLCNSSALNGADVDDLCINIDEVENVQQMIDDLMQQPFSNDMITFRKQVLLSKYNNIGNAHALLDFMDKITKNEK
ncbi:MAG TPA: hypothetical protein PKD39_11775 [Chitinophagales bacterium]|nr:hypothetical protein [Chitinophagales bacterium]HNB49946.1 hypothetical protein [Chitinophagales bacterium]